MADPKKPDGKETTRPIPPISERTEPIAPSEITRPTLSITRPTVVFPKESTRPVSPVRPSSTRTPAVRPSGLRNPVARPSSTKNPVVGARSSSTGMPAVRRTGTTSRVSQTVPSMRPELMTDGMRARRREIERKKRRAALERMRMAEELSEGWRRIWKTTGFVLLALALGYGYWRIQNIYGDRWPLMAVWLMMAGFILTGFGWILWYMNKSDI